MSADPAAADVVPLHRPRGWARRRADPARFARSQRHAFSGQNLTVGRSSVVHATVWADWIDDLQLPIPACRQGFSGHGTHTELRPTRWPVTCRRCRHLSDETVPARADEPVQETLFPLPMPSARTTEVIANGLTRLGCGSNTEDTTPSWTSARYPPPHRSSTRA